MQISHSISEKVKMRRVVSSPRTQFSHLRNWPRPKLSQKPHQQQPMQRVVHKRTLKLLLPISAFQMCKAKRRSLPNLTTTQCFPNERSKAIGANMKTCRTRKTTNNCWRRISKKCFWDRKQLAVTLHLVRRKIGTI